MVNENGMIVIPCPVCKVPVAPHSIAELVEWYPRHCAVSPQCASGDVRQMTEMFERALKKLQEMLIKKMEGSK